MITPLWPRQSPPLCRAIASCYPLTFYIANHCSLLPLLLPSMVGCCMLPSSIACCLIHCPPLPSLTLLLPAATPPSFQSAPSSFLLPPFLLQWWPSLLPPLLTLTPSHAPLIIWCGRHSSVLAGCCATSCHATCRLHLLSRHCLLLSTLTGCCVATSASPYATTSHWPVPPCLFIQCLLLLPPASLSSAVEVD